MQEAGANAAQQQQGASVHTVITTECTAYFDWQSLGLVYRHVDLIHPALRPTSCIAAAIWVNRVLPLQSSATQQPFAKPG